MPKGTQKNGSALYCAEFLMKKIGIEAGMLR